MGGPVSVLVFHLFPFFYFHFFMFCFRLEGSVVGVVGTCNQAMQFAIPGPSMASIDHPFDRNGGMQLLAAQVCSKCEYIPNA